MGGHWALAKDSPVPILTVDGYAFKDFLRTGELAPYEDWRLSSEERARDLAQRLSMENIAGLMLYSPHQLIPAKGPLAAAFGGTYGGKSYEERGAEHWALTDQQKEFISKGKVRHVLIMGLESTQAAVRWNNALQALAEGTGFGIPANNSSDPRHGAGSTAEYMGVTGEDGRDAHYAYGKYAVYPGGNFNEHLKPFTQGAFALPGKTGKASAVMPYYTISCGMDRKNGENVGNSYSKYLIHDLLRDELGYDGMVFTDWGITHDMGETEEAFAGKCWGVEGLTPAQRHYKALEAGVDQFGGNSDAAPVLERPTGCSARPTARRPPRRGCAARLTGCY